MAALALAPIGRSQTSSAPEADPSRPTVTNPAHIPPVGYLQFEQGFGIFAQSPNDNTSTIGRQFNLLQSTKISVTPRLLLIAVAQPFARTSFVPTSMPVTHDAGDVLLTTQAVLFDTKHGHGNVPSVSLAYTHRVFTGTAPSNDIGSTVQGVNLLVGGNAGKFHYDANVIVNETVGSAGPQRRLQQGQTAVFAYNVTPKFSVSAEIWRFSQPFLRSNAIGNLYAVGYSVRPNIVLDAGFNHGLTSTSTRFAGFAGFTYLLPHRLWPKRRP